MKTDDIVWIASMTKPATAAAVMLLVDEQRLGLDDPVEKFITAFHNLQVAKVDGTLEPAAAPITVRQLLAPTSGMGFLNRVDRGKIDSSPLPQSIEHDLLEPLHSQPGTKYLYSNQDQPEGRPWSDSDLPTATRQRLGSGKSDRGFRSLGARFVSRIRGRCDVSAKLTRAIASAGRIFIP